jgi:hypothetical protein
MSAILDYAGFAYQVFLVPAYLFCGMYAAYLIGARSFDRFLLAILVFSWGMVASLEQFLHLVGAPDAG